VINTEPKPADQNFMLAAAQGGMTEVKLGELAARKREARRCQAVRPEDGEGSYGINDDLKALAAQKGVTLPDSLDAKHQADGG
jgi:putative membrane protein